MVFLLRKKATATAKAAKENEALAAAAAKQQQLQAAAVLASQAQQQATAASTPKVFNGEALSAMSIQYDSDRIKQSPTYSPSNTLSKTSSNGLDGTATVGLGMHNAAAVSEPIDQILAREAYASSSSSKYDNNSDERSNSTSTTRPSPSTFRRTSSAHADITAHSQTLPPVHSSVAPSTSSPSSSTYYPSTKATPQSNSYYANSNNPSSSSSYGYYRSTETDKHRRGSGSSESSYAASETSDILHNSVGGRSSSGGTTATTPGSTNDKELCSSQHQIQRKNSLVAQAQTQAALQAGRPLSIERVPVPTTTSSATSSTTATASVATSSRKAAAAGSAKTLTTPETISASPSPALSSSSSFARKTASRYTLTDFNFQRTLGTGSFGRVHLVRSCHNMRFYAVKVLNKERVVRMKQVEHTNSEREMLERVRHPFLVNLWGTFKDSQNLYMVMDFVSGGELFSLLRKSQRFPDAVAKFFAAEVALALDYLHSLDIIYRDLKPENILLAADGHVKITDFGFAKYVPDITWTLCGTPDYLAPEIVQSKGYNKSVDWYALGVLIFEMLAGYPPFFTEDSNPMRLYEKIIAGKVRYPSYFTEEAKDLLRNLLTGDLSKRFGNLANGSRDIFGHSYFTEVDWNRLYRKEIPAPYVPRVEGDGDSSNFDTYAEIDVSEYGQVGSDPHGHLFTCF